MPEVDEEAAEQRELRHKLIRTFAGELSIMPAKDKRLFVKTILSLLSDEEKKEWMLASITYADPKARWAKVKRWMEKRFTNNYNQTPRKVVSTALFYFKLDSRMTPLMIKLAQSAKNKIWKRNKVQSQPPSPEGRVSAH